MPELPEVETIVRDLAPVVTGRRIRSLAVLDRKLASASLRRVHGRVIQSVNRIGKEIVFDLGRNCRKKSPLWLCVHLRMTGRLVYTEESAQTRQKFLRARIDLDQGRLLFIDLRRFGIMRLLTDLTGAFPTGIEPLSEGFTARKLGELLAGSTAEIKPWLLRQDKIVGLGNIYASEILFAARIAPDRAASSLNATETKRLYNNTRRVLNRAIKYCGTTFSDFQGGHGQSGRFRRMLKVYGREGKTCFRCGGEILRLAQQGRSTFFCPDCQ